MNVCTRVVMLIGFFVIIVSGCKKDNGANDDKTPSLQLEKTAYTSLEMAQLLAEGITLTQQTYQGNIGNETVEVYRFGNALVFAMPVLQTGSHTLSLNLNGTNYNANFSITALSPVADAASYLTGFTTDFATETNMLRQLADSLPANRKAMLLADLQTLESQLNQANQQFLAASNEDKQAVANFLQANKPWMDSLNLAINAFTLAAGQLKTGVDNHERNVNTAMENYLNAKAVVIKHIPKLLAFSAAGFLIGNVPGAAIGAGIAAYVIIKDINKLNLSVSELMDAAIVPFEQMFASDKATISFANDESKDVYVSLNYRTPYAADASSSVPLLSDLVGGLADLKQEWDNLLQNLSFPLQFGPVDISTVSSYTANTRQVHSEHLGISNISSGNITSSIDRTDGYFRIKFSSTSTTDQNFTFNVNYTNARFGNFSYTVSAELTNGPSTFTDPRDGQTYNIVQIGSQTWFAENLNYQSGSSWCYDDNPGNCDIYGRLYDWAAAQTACPVGWHLPSSPEWTILINYLGDVGVAGGKLKSTQYWDSPNAASNSSGFSALPGGLRSWNGTLFGDMGAYGYYWATESTQDDGKFYSMVHVSENIGGSTHFKTFAHSVRCVKD